MSRFTDAQFRFTGNTIKGRLEYELMGSMAYDIGSIGSGWTVTAPAGFRSDGPSVPLLVAWMLPVGRMARSAVIHDQMRKDPRHSKLLGDYIFLEAMKVEGVSFIWRWIAFIAVLFNFQR